MSWVVYAAVMTDLGYRNMVALGHMPDAICCPGCGAQATFRGDRLAARYECARCGHAVAAMWADLGVAGKDALR